MTDETRAREQAEKLVREWAPEWEFGLLIADHRYPEQENPRDRLVTAIAAALTEASGQALFTSSVADWTERSIAERALLARLAPERSDESEEPATDG